jgi:hypothetical protein
MRREYETQIAIGAENATIAITVASPDEATAFPSGTGR